MTSLAVARRRATATPTFLALGCVGAFLSGPAFAETPADAPGDAANTDQVDARADILVHGIRERRGAKDVAKPIDTPRSVVVLTDKVIKQSGSATLEDALRTVPGITFGAAEGGNPLGDRPFIRGFDSQGSIYLDGVRDMAAQSREVFAVESIQVVRGSDSTLGGRGSAGGSINILSKLPQSENVVTAAVSYGSADYKRATVDANYRLTDSVAIRIAAVAHDQDVAGRDAIWQRRWGVAPSLTIGLGTPTRLTAAYYHLTSHELPDSGIPYLFTIGNAPGTGDIHTGPAIGTVTLASGATGRVDRAAFYGLANRDFRDATVDQGTLRLEHDFGGVTLRNTLRLTGSDQSYILTQPDDSQGNVYDTGQVWRRANTRDSHSDSIVDQTDLFGTVRTGGIEHSFAVGAEFSRERARRGTYVLASGSTLKLRCSPDAVARSYCTSLFAPEPDDTWVNYMDDTSTVTTPIVGSDAASQIHNEGKTLALYAFDSITLLPSSSSISAHDMIASTRARRPGRLRWRSGGATICSTGKQASSSNPHPMSASTPPTPRRRRRRTACWVRGARITASPAGAARQPSTSKTSSHS